MRWKTLAKVTLSIVIFFIATGLIVLTTFGIASSGTRQANGRCEMQIIEKKISLVNATEYRRACMASNGYGMLSSCYVNDYTGASCFRPQWMFWIQTI